MRVLHLKKVSRQSKRLALFLTFCAGYIDAYTFILRGNTLVAGQTGNVVFLSVGLIQQNVSDTEAKLLTLLAFMLGIYLLTRYSDSWKLTEKPILSLFPLALLCILIAFLPTSFPNSLIVPPLAFCMGLLSTAFGQVSGTNYNNAFMTGNIKRTMMSLGNYARTKKKMYLTEGLLFLSLVSIFSLGVLLGAYLTLFFQEKTILGIPFLMAILYLYHLCALKYPSNSVNE